MAAPFSTFRPSHMYRTSSFPSLTPSSPFTLSNCLEKSPAFDPEQSFFGTSNDASTADDEEQISRVTKMKRGFRSICAKLVKMWKLMVMKIEYATYRATNAVKMIHQRRKSRNDSFIYYGEDLLKITK